MSRDAQPMYTGSIQENLNKAEKEPRNTKISEKKQK